MLYCFWLIITSTAFWFVRINEIADLFTGLYADGRWPVDIYPNWLRYGLTFLVPASALAGRLSLQTWLDALALTVALFTITRFICSVGLKNYSNPLVLYSRQHDDPLLHGPATQVLMSFFVVARK